MIVAGNGHGLATPNLGPILFAHTLDCLLSPVPSQEFFKSTWARKSLHIARGDRTLTARDLFPTFSFPEIVESAVASEAAMLEVLELTGSRPAQGVGTLYESPVERLMRTKAAIESGHSILIKEAQRFSAEFASVLRDLEQLFYLPMSANVYYSPPGASGFRWHFDNHDTLVVQLEGSKAWKIGCRDVVAPLENPPDLEFERPLRRAFGYNYEFRSPVSRELDDLPEHVLQRGDTLYVPRGFLHRAVAGADCPSVHLTIAISTLTWTDVAVIALRKLARENEALRGSLPLLRIDGEAHNGSSSVAEGLSTLPEMLDTARRELADHTFQALQYRGLISTSHAFGKVAADTMVERSPGTIARAASKDGQMFLEFASKRVSLPDGSADAADFIAYAKRFRACDLPGLDPSAQQDIVRVLLSAGLLRLVS